MAIATPQMQGFQAIAAGSPAQIAPVTVDPNQIQQPTAMTTQQQLAGILSKGGALMQAAATTGNQSAASRGLLNSSMGVQAAQGAMIDRAAPIAQSDASAINSMAAQNAQAYNNVLTGNANIQNSANQWNAAAQNDINKFNTTNANAAGQWNAGQQNEATLKAMDVNSRETLANIEASYKQLMQVNSSAENMYNQVMKNISDIQNNKDIADKGTAVNSQLAWLRSGMSMIQNLNGVQNLITF
jgi:hypothetical protein